MSPTIDLASEAERSLLQTLYQLSLVQPAIPASPGPVPDYELVTAWPEIARAWQQGESTGLAAMIEVRHTLEALTNRSISFGEGYEPIPLLTVFLLYGDTNHTDNQGVRIRLSGYVSQVLSHGRLARVQNSPTNKS